MLIPLTKPRCRLIGVAMAIWLLPWYGHADGAAQTDIDSLLELDIEELIQIEVSTVSRKKEPKQQTPAAVTVITQEDIRRSGATSLPEALRLVPGLAVAELDANKWSVTARGFGGRYANKLLVLVDGVSIYSPLFSGTFWEIENLLVENIDRIEVVRGPGGAAWGANAVNGVVNIITKSAKDTQGGLLRIGAGTEKRAQIGLRYGEEINENLHLRVSTQYRNMDNYELESGEEAKDRYSLSGLQLRLDWTPSTGDELTFSAKGASASIHETYLLAQPLPPYQSPYNDDNYVNHGNLMLRWRRTFHDGDDFQIRAYYDYWRNGSVIIDDRRQVIDIEVQRRQTLGADNQLVYGGGVRHVWDDVHARYAQFHPARNDETTYSAFAHLTVPLLDDRLKLIAGARLEHNDYTGFEIEPMARFVWSPNHRHTLWGAVSRAVRVPARGETNIYIPAMAGPGFLAALNGYEDLDSESLMAYETGYRFAHGNNFSLEANAFFNDYAKLRSIELMFPRPILWEGLPTLLFPLEARNNLEGTTIGGSVSMDWRIRPWWRMRTSYAYIDADLRFTRPVIDFISKAAEGDVPRTTVTLWNSFELTKRTSLDILTQYVGRLSRLDVPDYVDLDVRLAWRPNDSMELALIGQNLLEPERLEYRASLVDTLPSKVQRGVYAEWSWSF